MVVSGGGGNSLANLKDPMKDYLVWFQVCVFAFFSLHSLGLPSLRLSSFSLQHISFGSPVSLPYKLLS